MSFDLIRNEVNWFYKLKIKSKFIQIISKFALTFLVSQITLIKIPKPDNTSSLVGSEAKNPLPSTDNFLCPNCSGGLRPYSRCFDCKQVIQLICYKCQLETSLSEHTECHKNVSMVSNRITNFKKRNYTAYDELKNKINDLYHIPFQTIAPVFNLIH